MNNMMEQGTPKVLREFMNLMDTPTHEKFEENSQKHRDYIHPDIDYFRKVKDKNHFKYHKTKHGRKHAEKIQAMMTDFNPYSREALLERLSTFSALNWNVPLHSIVSELTCARKGWKCMSYSVSSSGKNNLFCDWCGMQLILSYNEPGESQMLPFEFDMDDIKELNFSLDKFYMEKIEHSGHHKGCSWRNFETPLDGCYYLRPYLQSTNETLTTEYLSILKKLLDNRPILDNFAENTSIVMPSEYLQDPQFTKFVTLSSSMVLNAFYKDDKENMMTIINTLPKWYFHISILGWELKVQSFSHKLVYMLICSKCNQRVFMTYNMHSPLKKGDTDSLKDLTELKVPESNILSPCDNPITISANSRSEFDEEEEENFDAFKEHKEWCQYLRSMDEEDTSFYSYFISMLTGSNENENEFNERMGDNRMNKRTLSIDINDSVRRLNKLRKVYLIDE